MNIEQQVTSLELSKRLKELGVKQESLFYWHNRPKVVGRSDYTINLKENTPSFKHQREVVDIHDIEYVSAFTVAELGEIIIPHYKKLEQCEQFVPQNDKEFVKCLFSPDYYAKVLVYLLENKIIKL